MERFDIWAQIQEIAGDRFLVLATACPVEAGGQTLFSKVVHDRGEAARVLGELVDELEQQVKSTGDAVVEVHKLEPNLSEGRPGEDPGIPVPRTLNPLPGNRARPG